MNNTWAGKKFPNNIYKVLGILFMLSFSCGAHAGEIITSVRYNPKEVSINNSGKNISVNLTHCKNIVSDKKALFPVQDFFVVLPPSGFVTKITIYGHKVVSIPVNKQSEVTESRKPLNDGKRIEYLGEQWIDGKNIGVVRVYPLQYDKSRKNLLLSTDLKFKIRYRTTRRRII